MSLPEGWRETTLGEVVDIKGGKRLPKGETLISTQTNHPYIRITDLDNNQVKINQLQFISDKTFSKISRYIVNTGDVIVSVVGTIGLVALIDERLNNANLTENCNKLIIKNLDTLNSKYLFYYLISRIGQYEINKNTVGAVQKKLPIYGLDNIFITLPPIQEQKAIANILSSFDEKIELLKEQNETLEQMAQGVFREWFVDIETIPTNWQVTQLKDISEKISKGTTPRKKDVEGLAVTVPFLKVKDITDNGNIKISALEKIPNEVHIKALKRSILEENDLLYSIAGTIGRVAILPKELDNINCNQAVAFIRLKEKNRVLEYVHQWIQTRDIKAKIDSSIVQGVQANVSLGTLGDLEIVIPNDTILSKWNDFSKPIYEKLKNNTMQIQTLQKTRDTLLPKLMSGEVRVL